ncbi:hypothetical protein ACFV7Q_11040 [Streptomyces sp. NPDC059851]|uniref:hypothetical protein n=1 Tax=Streptomyces sp. NPDC059851 TaxID=3346971 RepID=UPI003655D775
MVHVHLGVSDTQPLVVLGAPADQSLGLILDGLLANLPSDIIAGGAVAVFGVVWTSWRRRRSARSEQNRRRG